MTTTSTVSQAAREFISQVSELVVALDFPPKARIVEREHRARAANKRKKQATKAESSKEEARQTHSGRSESSQEVENGVSETESKQADKKLARKIQASDMKKDMNERKNKWRTSRSDGDVHLYWKDRKFWHLHKEVIRKESSVMWDQVESTEAELPPTHSATHEQHQENGTSREPVRIDIDESISMCMLQNVFYFMYHHEYQASHPMHRPSNSPFTWSLTDAHHVGFNIDMYLASKAFNIARLEDHSLLQLGKAFDTFNSCLKSAKVTGKRDDSFRRLSAVLAQSTTEVNETTERASFRRLGQKMCKILDMLTIDILGEDPGELDRQMIARASMVMPPSPRTTFATHVETLERSTDFQYVTSEVRPDRRSETVERAWPESEYPPSRLMAPGWSGARRAKSLPLIRASDSWELEEDDLYD